MTDAVADTIECLQQRMRLLEQLVCDAERVIEDRDHTIERQKRDLENHRLHAMMVDDYERPEVIAQILKHRLRGWPRARWQALADCIRRLLAETGP
jgi:hypothetical protein